MTILFFSRLFYPHIGGVEKHVFYLSKELIKKGNKITVITEQYDISLPEKETYENIEIFRIPVLNSSHRKKKFVIWFWLFQNRHIFMQVDVIHCHDVFFWYLPFRFLFPNKSIFTTFHGYEGDKLPTKKSILMHRLAEKLSWGNICVGNFLEKWYGTHASLITYGAVDFIKPSLSTTQKKNLNAVFVGRLEEETGIMLYLRCLRILKEENLIINLRVAGDGSLAAVAKTYVKMHSLSVTFLGFVNDPSIEIKKADFVFVSRYLGIMESLAQKKHIFAVYNNKIKKNYLTETPFAKFIAIAKDEWTLTRQIRQHIDNKRRDKKKMEKEYRWAIRQTWEKLASQYENLWKKRRHNFFTSLKLREKFIMK